MEILTFVSTGLFFGIILRRLRFDKFKRFLKKSLIMSY